jgi:hypothetical protein
VPSVQKSSQVPLQQTSLLAHCVPLERQGPASLRRRPPVPPFVPVARKPAVEPFVVPTLPPNPLVLLNPPKLPVTLPLEPVPPGPLPPVPLPVLVSG